MPKLTMKKGTTGKILRVRIQAATTGNPITGLVYNSPGLAASFIREGDSTATAISLVAGTVGIWTSGGFKEVDPVKFPGTYELGAPNAALTGANSVYLEINGYAGMLPVPFEVQLDATDNQDGVRGGMTALPNANAGANTGLPLGNGSGQVTLTASEHTAIQADTTAALNAAMPGSPTAGSAFAAIKTNLDTAVSSRQSGSAAVTLPTTPPAGYLASDMVTAMKADPQWKLLLSHASGRFTYDPTTGALALYDTDGTTVLKTLTLTVDASKNVTLRV